MPPAMAAGSGADALTHAIEAYVSNRASVVTDVLALGAARLVAENLRPAVAGSPRALYNMLLASCVAGMSFGNAGLGLVHAMALPLSARFGLHHGTACAILLPVVMEYNLISSPEKFGEIAHAMGVVPGGTSDTVSVARSGIAAVRQLLADIGLPARLADVGVREEDVPGLAEDAVQTKDIRTNPRRWTLEDIEALYRKVL